MKFQLRAFFLSTTTAFLGVTAVGCSGDASIGEEVESEPTAMSNEELASAIDCRVESAIGYPNRDGVPKTIQVVRIAGKAVTKPAAHAFLELQRGAQAAGVSLSLTSGFRTNAEQQRLYNCFRDKVPGCNPADPPGTSAHQKGSALDVSQSAWLAANAARFGFRRPFAHEPWHIEYDGADPGGPCGSDESGASDPPWVSPNEGGTYKNGVWFKVKPAASVSAKVRRVTYEAGVYTLGTSTEPTNDFAVRYTFNTLGARSVTATAVDAAGMELFSSTVSFTVVP